MGCRLGACYNLWVLLGVGANRKMTQASCRQTLFSKTKTRIQPNKVSLLFSLSSSDFGLDFRPNLQEKIT
jgi:hypothetical protein